MKTTARFLQRSVALVAVCTLSPPSAFGAWRMEILPEKWQLTGFENALDLSGIAAANAHQVLVGSDERFHIQPGFLDREKHSITSQPAIELPLLSKTAIQTKAAKLEVDIEGVCFSPSDHAYFVIGSHGLGKKKGDYQAERHSIYRVPVDPVSGIVIKESITRSSLLPWLSQTPEIAPFIKQPLQQNGLNIEGLTWENGNLFIGLRAPNKNGWGLIIEIKTCDLFGASPKPLKVLAIPVAEGRGIREITSVNGGFVIITGNASAPASKKIPVSMAPGPDTHFELLFWNGRDAAVESLGHLPHNGGKGEALLVLADTKEYADLLIVFDGLLGGAPLSVRLHR